MAWVHLHFRNDEVGWAARKRLVEGLSEEMTPDLEEWLHLEVYPGVPLECRCILGLYGRKYSPVVQRRVLQSDYTARGVMTHITQSRHGMYYAKKSANKAAV